MAKKRSYAYGTCPTCKSVGYHKQKKSGIIYLEGNTKAYCSRFKCKNCGSWFGFYDEKHWENVDEEEVEREDWKKIADILWDIDDFKLPQSDRKRLGDIRVIVQKHVRNSDL